MNKISVLTVVKNGYPQIIDSINSFFYQDYKEKELIVVCSPSTDGTEEYLRKINNINLIFDKQSVNKFESLNLGLKKVKGNIVGLLHSDDIYDGKDVLSSVDQCFQHYGCKMLYGDIKFSSRSNLKKIIRKWISGPFKFNKIKNGWMPPHTSIFLDKEIVKKINYLTNFPISGDYDYILNLLINLKIKPKYLNKNLIIMRSGGDSTKINKLLQKLVEDMKIAKKYFKNYYILTVLFKIIRKLNQFI